MPQYRARVRLWYPHPQGDVAIRTSAGEMRQTIRREPGDLCDGLPAGSIARLLERGAIELVAAPVVAPVLDDPSDAFTSEES